jgi:hypothetical protein
LAFAQSNFLPDPKLFVWDIESDNLQYFNLATGKLDVYDHEDAGASPVDQEQLTVNSTLEK